MGVYRGGGGVGVYVGDDATRGQQGSNRHMTIYTHIHIYIYLYNIHANAPLQGRAVLHRQGLELVAVRLPELPQRRLGQVRLHWLGAGAMG